MVPKKAKIVSGLTLIKKTPGNLLFIQDNLVTEFQKI